MHIKFGSIDCEDGRDGEEGEGIDHGVTKRLIQVLSLSDDHTFRRVFVDASLDEAKSKVGTVKLMHGDSAWQTAQNYCNDIANVGLQHSAVSRAYYKL